MAVGNTRNGEESGQAIETLLNSLEQIFYEIDIDLEEKVFLQDYLESPNFKALLLIYQRINNLDNQSRRPITHNSLPLSEEVFVKVRNYGTSNLSRELLQIIENPFFKRFLEAHDLISRKDYIPALPDLPLEEEETVKIVQLVKSNEPLGATIRYDEDAGSIVIARIMHGGAADRSGLIHVGDEVHEVNGINVSGRAPIDLVNILEHSKEGPITFKLVPGEDFFPSVESRVRVRAHFCYDPSTDPIIPCREAGLPFIRGEILHIVCQEDPNWWQARKHGERNSRAGLIPGRQLQERRLATQRDLSSDFKEPVPGCQLASIKDHRHRKIKKIMYDVKENDDFDREEIATYEEVAKLYPRPGLHRPIVLIGPSGIGRNELKRRLIETDSELYKATVAHTSRPQRPWEVDGREYHFASREFMEEEIRVGRFIEYGEYQGNLYGTSIDTVKGIIKSGLICVMTPHPQALKKIRTPEVKPFVIFVKSPPFELLKESRMESHARSTFDETCSRGFTDEEFELIEYESQRLEYLYGHLFDAIVMNYELGTALRELLAIVCQIDSGPKWVPASWVTSS